MEKKFSKYHIILGVMGVIATLLLLCQPVEGLSDYQFLAVLAITKGAGAALVVAIVKLAERWDREGKIILKGDTSDDFTE